MGACWEATSGGFRGGDGGVASPPTSLKVTILAEKSALILNNSAPFRDASPPTDLNVTNPAEKSVTILVKTFFFFFFFGDHLILGEKNVWISDFGRKIRLNFGEDLFFFFFFWRPPDFGRKKRLNFRFRPKNQSQFWWRHPNFWGFGFKSPPTKIFWIRHWKQPQWTIVVCWTMRFSKKKELSLSR